MDVDDAQPILDTGAMNDEYALGGSRLQGADAAQDSKDPLDANQISLQEPRNANNQTSANLLLPPPNPHAKAADPATSPGTSPASGRSGRSGKSSKSGVSKGYMMMPVKSIHDYIDISILPKQQRQMIENLFHNNDEDTHIDLHELLAGAQNYNWQRKWLIILTVAVLFYVTCVFTESYVAATLTKETDVEGGVLRAHKDIDGRHHVVVRTGDPRSLVRIDELLQLPTYVLEHLKHVTLTEMVDARPVYHHYKVAGFKKQEPAASTSSAQPLELVLQTSVPGITVRLQSNAIDLVKSGQAAIPMVAAMSEVPPESLRAFCKGSGHASCAGFGHGTVAMAQS